jgi:hypothetical protein
LWACRGPFPVAAQVSHVHPTHFPKFQIITEHPSPLQKKIIKIKNVIPIIVLLKEKYNKYSFVNPPEGHIYWVGFKKHRGTALGDATLRHT